VTEHERNRKGIEMKKLLPAILMLCAPLAFAGVNLSLNGVLELVIYLVVVGLIFWVIWWFLGYVGVPEPFNKVIRVILGLVALIIVINLLLGLIGNPLFTFR
jgi:hypothetical protein